MTTNYQQLITATQAVLTAREAHIRAVKGNHLAREDKAADRLEIALDNLGAVQRVCCYIDQLAPAELDTIRDWAHDHGLAPQLGGGDTIPYEIAEAYRTAHLPHFIRSRRGRS